MTTLLLAAEPLTTARSLAMRRTLPSPQLPPSQPTMRNFPLAPRSAKGRAKFLTVTMRNQTSRRTRTKMDRMTRAMSLPRHHRKVLPQRLSRRSAGPSLKDLDETMRRLPRRQKRRMISVKRKGTTSSKLKSEQLHPVARQTAKLRKETRTRISAVVQVGRAHQYLSCLLACTHLIKELLANDLVQTASQAPRRNRVRPGRPEPGKYRMNAKAWPA